MSLIVKESSGSDFEPIAAGLHHAVCYGVVDIGTQMSANPQFPARRKVVILWELPSERIEITKDGQKLNLPRGISGVWTLSLASKGKLRPMLESWRGRPFTTEELAGFDMEKLLGANCYLNITHNHKGDRVYANVASVNPLPKGVKPMKSENPTLFYASLPNAFPTHTPQWIQAKIMQSEEWLASKNEQPPAQEEQTQVNQAADDNVPF